MMEISRLNHGGDHGGSNGAFNITRLFASHRNSMKPNSLIETPSSPEERQTQEELRRHVRAVTMGDERPLPVLVPTRNIHRHSADLGRSRPNKLRSKRRAASTSCLPVVVDSTGEETLADGDLSASSEVVMAPTITIQPIRVSRFEVGPPGLEAIDEDEPSTPRSPTVSYHAFPPHSKVNSPTSPISPTSPTKRFFESPPPSKLNSPRKLSGSSTVSTLYSRESAKSEIVRTSSWGSKSSFETFESGQWRPMEGLNRPEPLKKRRTMNQPNEMFAALPAEVLALILEMLKRQHLENGTESCATCWMRNLCNISLSSRKWAKFARIALYEDIQLVGADSAAHRKKYKLILGPRLLMLRKTLRSNTSLATLVRSLKVPRPDSSIKGVTTKNLDQYEDLVASLVMACPNLERLSGPTIVYNHSFKKVFHALSTRTQLKDMDWLIEPLPSMSTKQRQKSTPSPGLTRTDSGIAVPAELELHHEGAFLDLHRNWSMLTTLSIHCLPGATVSPDTLLTRTLSMMPSLRHLHLCNLPANSFTDATLLALPQLQTLSLTHITGITSNGLSSFATCSASQRLRSLHLRHTPLTSLPALARIFSNLTLLSDFALVQSFPPLMPEADTFALWMMPYLASNTVKKLHWDITSHRDCANVADDILGKSIAAGGFPQLKLLRAPNDPEAVFQNLCRPVERIELPADRFSIPEAPTSPLVDAIPTSPARFLQKSPRTPPPHPQSPMSFDAMPPQPCTDLRLARLAAQLRLEKASSKPRFSVFVTSEDGEPVETFQLAGFLGTVGSPIHYLVTPDFGSTDQKGGIVDARDLARDFGESLAGGREGCTGSWNRREGVVADKKEREAWWHTERGRWTSLQLS